MERHVVIVNLVKEDRNLAITRFLSIAQWLIVAKSWKVLSEKLQK